MQALEMQAIAFRCWAQGSRLEDWSELGREGGGGSVYGQCAVGCAWLAWKGSEGSPGVGGLNFLANLPRRPLAPLTCDPHAPSDSRQACLQVLCEYLLLETLFQFIEPPTILKAIFPNPI